MVHSMVSFIPGTATGIKTSEDCEVISSLDSLDMNSFRKLVGGFVNAGEYWTT